VKTLETVCHEVFRELQRAARQFEAREFRVIAAPQVIARLMEEQSQDLAELEEQLKRPIRLQSESLYLQDGFDVVPI
jgi:ribonuclease G